MSSRNQPFLTLRQSLVRYRAIELCLERDVLVFINSRGGFMLPLLFFIKRFAYNRQAKKQKQRGVTIMPKMKTHKGAAKRFRKTGTGKLKRAKAFKSHILTKKSAKRKRNLRKGTYVSTTQEKAMKKLLPYL